MTRDMAPRVDHAISDTEFTCAWCERTKHWVAVDAGPYGLTGGHGLAVVDDTVVVGAEARHLLSGEIVQLRHDCPAIPEDHREWVWRQVTNGGDGS